MGRIFLATLLAAATGAILPAGTLNLVSTNEGVSHVGLGANAAGLPQARTTYGRCAYDGAAATTCTLTGNFTGLAAGGAYRMVITYPGNGPSPIVWTASAPGSNAGSHALNTATVTLFLTLGDGSTPNFLRPPFAFTYSTATCSPGISPCGIGAVAQVPGATIEGTGTVSVITTPSFRPTQGAISAGAFGAFSTAAPGSWVELYGVNFATNLAARSWAGADFNGPNAPAALDGTRVSIGGQPAFLSYISPGQLNVQVPSNLAPGTHPIVVSNVLGGDSAPYNITLNRLQPGLLTTPDFLINGTQYVAALFPDAATFVLPPGAIPGVASRRARPGDFLVLYGVGFGPVLPDTPSGRLVQGVNELASPLVLTIGGVRAQVTYAGLAPGYVGLYQINVVVPQVPPGDATPLAFTLGEAAGSQTLFVPIGN